jgi:hypothetical protein
VLGVRAVPTWVDRQDDHHIIPVGSVPDDATPGGLASSRARTTEALGRFGVVVPVR